MRRAHTGSICTSASLSTVGATLGLVSSGPMTGSCRKNDTTTPKKSPNRFRIPNISIKNPTNERRYRIRIIPRANRTVPLTLRGRVKNAIVLGAPMIRMMPAMKRTLPKANSRASKSITTPSKKQNTPPAIIPAPHSTC